MNMHFNVENFAVWMSEHFYGNAYFSSYASILGASFTVSQHGDYYAFKTVSNGT